LQTVLPTATFEM